MTQLTLLTEDLIKISQAAKEFPECYRPHAQSVWRWTKKGVRGVKLEAIKIGGSMMTSKQAVTRFIIATQPGATELSVPAATPVEAKPATKPAAKKPARTTTAKRKTPASR